MLSLTIQKNEALYIGEEISIRVVRRKGDRFTIGILAPKGLRVLREAIFLRELQERAVLAELASSAGGGVPGFGSLGGKPSADDAFSAVDAATAGGLGSDGRGTLAAG